MSRRALTPDQIKTLEQFKYHMLNGDESATVQKAQALRKIAPAQRANHERRGVRGPAVVR